MTYSLSQLAWFFLIYSILGWCISVAFCAVKKHSFVNPGFLNLPVSPIYGIGAVLSTVFLSELTHHPLFFILGSCVLSGILAVFARSGANILTINQSIPVNGQAAVTIAARTGGMDRSVERLMAEIRAISGVASMEILARE